MSKTRGNGVNIYLSDECIEQLDTIRPKLASKSRSETIQRLIAYGYANTRDVMTWYVEQITNQQDHA